MRTLFKFFGTAVAVSALVLLTSSARAEDAVGTIIISQSNPPSNILGSWILIFPDNTQQRLNRDKYTLDNAPTGQYTVKFEQPQGSITSITALHNGEVAPGAETPQYSFQLDTGDSWYIGATYTFTLTGTVSVTTDPSGIPFTISGPNEWKTTGTTPMAFEEVPEGLYAVTFDVPKGCKVPPTLSNRLQKDSRISLSAQLSCDSLPSNAEADRNLTNVSGFVDGKQLTFTDVKMDEWYAPFIYNAVKINLMSGYRDEQDTPNGLFGPSDTVSLAQLAKVAHKLAGLDENTFRGESSNPAVNGQWFSSFYHSAESRYWLAFLNPSDDPSRPATRAEVVATLLQALDVSRVWPKGKAFSDVTPITLYADSIETAAHDGLVDENPNGNFNPDRSINRAELAKMLMKAVDLYKVDTDEIQPNVLDK